MTTDSIRPPCHFTSPHWCAFCGDDLRLHPTDGYDLGCDRLYFLRHGVRFKPKELNGFMSIDDSQSSYEWLSRG